MIAGSSTRRLFCLCLIVLGHLALIAAFRWQQPIQIIPKSHFSELQFITLSKPTSKPIIGTLRKTTLTHNAKLAQPINPVSGFAITPDHSTDTKTEPVSEPTLDLEGLRAGAVKEDMKRERSPIERLNESNLKNHSFEAKVEDATTKAQRDDCRTAYSGAGLFAPLIIATDLIRDKGCKF